MRANYFTALVMVISFSLAANTMARGPKGYGPGNNPGLAKRSQTGLQRSEFGRSNAVSHIKTNHIPPGHHYGWQKGTHNPHASPTP